MDKEIARLGGHAAHVAGSGHHSHLHRLDSVAALGGKSADNLDVANAAEVLDNDHYGLEKVKDRILEYIAVKKIAADKMRSPILCFVGPPGTGKTSLGRSIANALGREFVRISLGGVRDEAEIRGHRRTYIGAMPGAHHPGDARAGTRNPLFMLDEIDKLGNDFRGDPAAALLEVLDPEQNNSFADHYLDGLRSVAAFCSSPRPTTSTPSHPRCKTAWKSSSFPAIWKKRSWKSCRQFLVPQQLEAHGLADQGIELTKRPADLVRDYTREAGVRNLEREVANVCRKIARDGGRGTRRSRRQIAADEVRKSCSARRASPTKCCKTKTRSAWPPARPGRPPVAT
jgi:ATP-dependent Lon protease